jgi:hypothetical protein
MSLIKRRIESIYGNVDHVVFRIRNKVSGLMV